jgi:hypothetical protein
LHELVDVQRDPLTQHVHTDVFNDDNDTRTPAQREADELFDQKR